MTRAFVLRRLISALVGLAVSLTSCTSQLPYYMSIADMGTSHCVFPLHQVVAAVVADVPLGEPMAPGLSPRKLQRHLELALAIAEVELGVFPRMPQIGNDPEALDLMGRIHTVMDGRHCEERSPSLKTQMRENIQAQVTQVREIIPEALQPGLPATEFWIRQMGAKWEASYSLERPTQTDARSLR